jgi:hypothetical protein
MLSRETQSTGKSPVSEWVLRSEQRMTSLQVTHGRRSQHSLNPWPAVYSLPVFLPTSGLIRPNLIAWPGIAQAVGHTCRDDRPRVIRHALWTATEGKLEAGLLLEAFKFRQSQPHALGLLGLPGRRCRSSICVVGKKIEMGRDDGASDLWAETNCRAQLRTTDVCFLACRLSC